LKKAERNCIIRGQEYVNSGILGAIHFMETTKIAVFKGRQVRKTLHNNEWWFSITDVIEALTDSTDPKQYIKKMRQREPELDSYWGTICTPLELPAPDGKIRATNCANTQGIFRIIQSVPSPKAEPFKRWLAKVGYERVQEIEDPELATKRTRALYKAKGYSDDWIEKRMRGMAIFCPAFFMPTRRRFGAIPGGSEDGGLDEFCEFWPTSRSSSSIRFFNAAFSACSSAIRC